MKRKSAVKDLKIKLSHLYKINKEYERAVKKTFQLTKEQIVDTLKGENSEEQKDLNRVIEVVGKQRQALIKNYMYELKRLYRYLETVVDGEIKLILTLRHAHFLTWEQIADGIGGGLKAEDVRRMHEEFIIRGEFNANETFKTV